MFRATSLAATMAVILTACGDARARYGHGYAYPVGYGGYGCGGWDSTRGSRLARGVGWSGAAGVLVAEAGEFRPTSERVLGLGRPTVVDAPADDCDDLVLVQPMRRRTIE